MKYAIAAIAVFAMISVVISVTFSMLNSGHTAAAASFDASTKSTSPLRFAVLIRFFAAGGGQSRGATDLGRRCLIIFASVSCSRVADFLLWLRRRPGSYFLETFSDPIEGRWVKSSNSLYTGNTGAKLQGNALVLTQEAKRYGVAAPFTKETVPGKELVLQYELKYSKPLECGGKRTP